ncbi:HD domain-containing protein [Streptomyces viridochromogenes]
MSEIIAGVEIPETAAVAEATRLIQKMTSPFIYHHSRRVFAFGAIHAQRLGLEPDPELLYLSAMFHDAGLLTPFSDVEQRFEVDGADHARKFMLENGFPASSADVVWTAIALHTTPGIPGRMGPGDRCHESGGSDRCDRPGRGRSGSRPGGRDPRRPSAR